jgi:hypothetical protein
MAHRRVTIVSIPVLVMLAVGLGAALSPVQAAPADVASPAGPVTGTIVVFSPPGPVLPGILLLQPTPATGSLVVPLRLPSLSGSGPSIPQFQLVLPGPNPAQNTPVALAQLLSSMLASAQAAGSQWMPPVFGGPAPFLVSVFSTPSR